MVPLETLQGETSPFGCRTWIWQAKRFVSEEGCRARSSHITPTCAAHSLGKVRSAFKSGTKSSYCLKNIFPWEEARSQARYLLSEAKILCSPHSHWPRTKIWLLTNTPKNTPPKLWCFVLMWLCRSYSRQPRASPLPRPAFPLQDFFGEMPTDAALQVVPAWPGRGSPSSPAQPGRAGDKWMSKPS